MLSASCDARLHTIKQRNGGSAGYAVSASPCYHDARVFLLQVHLGLLEGRVTHIVWPPARMGRVAVQEQPARLLQTDRRHV
jgi:hypothetical protein